MATTKNPFRNGRFVKRIVVALCLSLAIFLGITVLLFGDIKNPALLRMTDLNKCPACYGVAVCPEIYSNQLILDEGRWQDLFNAKNIFYGVTKTSKRRVVLKKLAHNHELAKFDSNLCSAWNLPKDCSPSSLLNVTGVEEKIKEIVGFNITWPDVEPRAGLVMCPYNYGIMDLVTVMSSRGDKRGEIINIWTLLKINPEPIIIQVIPRTQGWPVPSFGGLCGRLEVVGYEGQPLTTKLTAPWHKRLRYALNIINAALDFTFKHDRFRFYLMDWSLDNMVVNEKDEVTFVDLEDIIVLDKHVSPNKDIPDWYKRYSRESMGPGFSFSMENICTHHLSDHNLWAACYILAGDDNPLLLPIPKEINDSVPHFGRLLNDCLYQSDRFGSIPMLHHIISGLLADENIEKNIGTA